MSDKGFIYNRLNGDECKIGDKRKRSVNFTKEEKGTLLQLVNKYKSFVECRKGRPYFVKSKNEAWEAITKSYNSTCTTGPRDVHMLRKMYNNLKNRAKQDANYNRIPTILPKNEKPPEIKIEVDIESVESSKSSLGMDNDECSMINSPFNEINKKMSEEKILERMFDGTFTECDDRSRSIMGDDNNAYEEDAAEYLDETIDITEEEPSNASGFSAALRENDSSQNNQAEQNNRAAQNTLTGTSNIHDLPNECKGKCESALQELYYKTKIELANYQKRNERQKYQFEQTLQQLRLKLIQQQVENEVYKGKLIKQQLENEILISESR